MKIVLVGNTPSKKNSKIMVFSKKKIIACVKNFQHLIFQNKILEKYTGVFIKDVLFDILATVEKTKPIMISNKNYYNWHKKNMTLLEGKHEKVSNEPSLVYIDLYRETKRRCDWNNISQAITDILVNLEILEDDSTQYCKPIFGRVYYDKKTPRAEVYLYGTLNELWDNHPETEIVDGKKYESVRLLYNEKSISRDEVLKKIEEW